jgi:outer membrane protein assembly factor BamB
MTLTIIPIAWGVTCKQGLLSGRLPRLPLAVLLAAIAVTAVLTARLSARAATPRWLRFVWWGSLGCWVLENGAIAISSAGPFLPRAYVTLIFVAAGLWAWWAAWMRYMTMPWSRRLAVLIVLVCLPVAATLVLKADGLAGDGGLNLAWRWTPAAGRIERFDPASLPATPRQAIALAGSASADDYPQFLGPQRLAVLPHAHLSRDWSGSPPRLLWRIAVGAGWGSMAVAGGYAFTQEQRGDQECVVCYRIATAAAVWCHTDRQSFQSTAGPGPRATPSIAGNHVYTLGAAGLLNCLQAETGRVVWSTSILRDNGAENLAHGVSGSPLVVDDLVIVSPTGNNGISLAAYHAQTGKPVWRAGRDQASYSSPMPATLAGARQILLHTSAGVTAHEPGTGQILWSFPWTNSVGINCSQPIPNAGGPDQVFLSTGYGTGSVLLRVVHAAGEWQPQVLWKSPSLSCKFSTAVVHKDRLYGLDEGRLVCLDLKTGRRQWKRGRYQHGQILLAGELLLVLAESGEVFLVDSQADGPGELGHFLALEGKTWNHPALAGRYLLVRNDREAACFQLPLAGGAE